MKGCLLSSNTFSLFSSFIFFRQPFAARTNRRDQLVIDTLCPYRIYHLDKLASYFDVTAITIFPAGFGYPVKNSTPFAAGVAKGYIAEFVVDIHAGIRYI